MGNEKPTEGGEVVPPLPAKSQTVLSLMEEGGGDSGYDLQGENTYVNRGGASDPKSPGGRSGMNTSPTGSNQRKMGGSAEKKAEKPGTSGTSGVGGANMPNPPDSDGSEEPVPWDIMTGYLRMSEADRDSICAAQARLMNQDHTSMIKDAIMGRVLKANFDATKALVKLMAYEGFSPVVIVSEMSLRAAAYNAKNPEITEATRLELDGVVFTVSPRASLSEDSMFLITLFLTRGNNLRKIMGSIDSKVKVALKDKMETYKIKSDTDEGVSRRKRGDKVTLATKDITLSRIAASFPHLTLSIASNTGIEGKVELTCMRIMAQIKGVTSNIPAILTHGLIPALLPKIEEAGLVTLKHFCYFFNVEQSITLQTPSAKRTIVNEPMSRITESAIKFVEAAINGPLNSDTDRKNILNHLHLVTPESDVRDWITVGASCYSRALTAPTYSILLAQLQSELLAPEGAART